MILRDMSVQASKLAQDFIVLIQSDTVIDHAEKIAFCNSMAAPRSRSPSEFSEDF